MTNELPLSATLLGAGWFPCLGTTEHTGMSKGDPKIVQVGDQFTTDFNNGIHVIYDERGWPWIIHMSRATEETVGPVRRFALREGAHVPHSNDGGLFVRDVVLPLYQKEAVAA